MDKYEQLEKLAKLKEQGILREEEFQKEKEKILASDKQEELNVFEKKTIDKKKLKIIIIIASIVLVIVIMISFMILESKIVQNPIIISERGIVKSEISDKKIKMDKTEVTVAEFEKCVKAGSCKKENYDTVSNDKECNYNTNNKNHPMNCVNSYGAEEYCKWVGKRLPTKEEWKYAAKGGENYKYAGSDNADEVAWYEKNSKNKTHKVGTKKANGYGLFDMNGNVWEWTDTGVIFGGGFLRNDNFQIDSQTSIDPFYFDLNIGFRCIQDIISESEMVKSEISDKKIKMDKTEVTVAEFEKCVTAGSCSKKNFQTNSDNSYYNYGVSGKENHPINAVNLDGANEYCKWAGKRLPTEKEWKYAAKGGENYKYAGSDNVDEVAWHSSNSGELTHEVGTKKANGYGLFDMNGNVWEWAGTSGVIFGGGFMGYDFLVDSYDTRYPSSVSERVGFRCVQD